MPGRQRLSHELVSSLRSAPGLGVDVPPPSAVGLPEKVVQFGTGAFLRGFAEYFIDHANRHGRFGGSIVAVSSMGSSRDDVLNDQDGLYTLAVQGSDGGAAHQSYRIISSLSRAISAREAWSDVLALAREPQIELVVSNTTEVGIALDEDDRFDAEPPRSYPGKLTRFLFERAKAFDYDTVRGLVVLPCELIEDNGARLREIVGALATRWSLDPRFITWLDAAVVFCNTLVDRIVPGAPPAAESERVQELFNYRDGLITACETYALWAIEGDDALRARLGFPGDDSRIIVAPDIRPYRVRKVRLLNGAHTITVPLALLAGFDTVYNAVSHERIGAFLRRALFDEIVPALDVPDAEPFARDTVARFANPYIRHALIDITLYQTTKMRVRIVPTIMESFERRGKRNEALAFGFAAYLAFMRGEVQSERRAAGLPVPDDPEGEAVRDGWHSVDLGSDASIAAYAVAVCANTTLWKSDLSAVPGFADAVSDALSRIVKDGPLLALDSHLGHSAAT